MADDHIAAQELFELMRTSSNGTVDPLLALSDCAHTIGDRFLRGVDPTSTAAIYRAGLRVRALPMLGHIPVCAVTTGLVDRVIDG